MIDRAKISADLSMLRARRASLVPCKHCNEPSATSTCDDCRASRRQFRAKANNRAVDVFGYRGGLR